MRRKLRLTVGIVAGVVVALIVAVWLLVDVNRYRAEIQTRLEQQLGREVTLGEMSLGLFPLRFQVENTVINEDPRFGDQFPFVRAERLDVRVSLASLLRGDVKVQSVELQRPSVELVKGSDGAWNFSTLGTGSGAGAPSTPPSPPSDAPSTAPPATPSPESPGREFSLGRLTVRDGQVALTDLQQGQARTVYDHIDLSVLNYAPGKPFSFELAAHLQGTGAQEIRLKGEGGPVSQDNPVNTPLRAELSLNEVGIDGLKKFFSTDMLAKAAGSLSGKSQVTNQSGMLAAVGNFKLDRPQFNDLDIGYPMTLEYDLGAKLSEGLFTITKATVGLGPTPLGLTGSVNTSTTPVNIDLSFKSGDVSIAEVARLASALGVAFAPGTTVAGRVSMDVQAKGAADNPALTGSIGGRDLQISGKDVPQPVTVQALDLALSPAEIRSNEFSAVSGKTTVLARFALTQYTSKSPVVDVGLRAPGASLPEIQSIARAYGMTGLDQVKGAGMLNLDLRATGPLQSIGSTEIIRALNGTLNLDFSPLQISGFDAASELATVGGFDFKSDGKNITDIVRFTGRILVKNGIAQTDDLKAQLPIGNFAAAGTADLAAEALNLRLSVVLSKAFSDKVGGSTVRGFMKTALSNSAGELVIPATVTGTFKQPKFAPDVKAFAKLQAQRLLPTFDNPAAAVSGLLGALGPKKEGQEQPAGQKSSDTVKGILGGLLGGKKTEPGK